MLTKDQLCRPLVILPALIVVYFLAFPADLEVLILAGAKVLALSGDVSPWLYILLSVVILGRTVTHIWGHRSQT